MFLVSAAKIPRATSRGLWVAHMGILASSIEIGFSRCFLPVVSFEPGMGLSPGSSRPPSGLGGVWTSRERRRTHGALFPAARGGQGAKLAGGDAQWRALDGPEPPEVLTNMRSRARRSAGVESSRRPRGFSAFHQHRLWFSNPSILGRAFFRDLVDSQNKLTFGRRVSATAP